MAEAVLTVGNRLGLHARASARLVKVAQEFESLVQVSYRDRQVNAKSIMGVMMLAAGHGAQVNVRADGPDEDAALEAIAALFARRFDEEQ